MFQMMKLTQTADAEKRSRIQKMLGENSIAYKIKANRVFIKYKQP